MVGTSTSGDDIHLSLELHPQVLRVVRILAGLCVEVAEHVFHDVANVGYAFQGDWLCWILWDDRLPWPFILQRASAALAQLRHHYQQERRPAALTEDAM